MHPDEATEQLYGLPVGTELLAAGTRIPDEFLETHARELLAAMAAPSYLPTGVASIDRYAAAEAASASAAARERGVDPAEVAQLSAATVAQQEAGSVTWPGSLPAKASGARATVA
jgi:hypothetical protein